MTWKEFKDRVEALGANDDDQVWRMDVFFPHNNNLEVEKEKKAGLRIYTW